MQAVDVLWVGLAYGMGMLSSRAGWPPVVGYLLAGFLLGVFGQQLGFEGGSTLHEWAEVGLLLLLFAVGLKMRVATLLRPEVWAVGSVHVVLFTLGICLFSGLVWGAGVALGLGLAFSSTVLAVKVLEEKRESNSFHGRTVLGILVLQDVIAVGSLAFLGVQTPSVWALLLLGLPLLRPLAIWLLEKSGHDELMLLLGLGLTLVGATLAHSVGLSRELGALLFGIVLSGHPQTKELSKTLWGLRETFLIAFFLNIGFSGGFPSPQMWVWVPLLLLLIPLKTVMFFFLMLWFRLRARTAFVAALALSSYGEFVFITVGVAVHSGQLSSDWQSVLAMTVACSIALSASLNHSAHALFDRFEPILRPLERRTPHPDHLPSTLGSARWLVVGMGRTGGAVYKMLEFSGQKVVGMDSDPNKLKTHRGKGRRVVYGDAEDPELWEHLDFSQIKGVVLTLPDLESKVRATQWLRKNAYKGHISVTSYQKEEDEFLEQGTNLIFRPFAEAGERLAERALEEVRGMA